MGKTPVEKLERIRNFKFWFRHVTKRQKIVYLSDIEKICGSTVWKKSIENKRVSFIGFFNEFDDVYGRDCVYIHLFTEKDREWLAYRAVNHGAIAIVSSYQIGDLPCIVVDDVWRVLKEVSLLYLEGYSGSKVAIAGSIGKTTTKEMVECVLSRKFKTFCTPNNGNVLKYLAFEIQHMPSKIEQFVQEVDESYPNNAADCSYVLQPEIAIITTIDLSHVSALGGEDKVKKAILDVTEYMPNNGTVIISADDPRSMESRFNQNVISVGIVNQTADCTASNIVSDDKSVDFIINYLGENTSIHLNCPGVHNVYNAMFAFVAGKLSGMTNDRIRKGLKCYRPMSIRQNTYRAFGKTLYVDCFNASAKSVGAALAVLKRMRPRRNGRRIAVLGDIAEIEGFEEQTYRSIADQILESDIDLLVTYGKDSKSIWDNLRCDVCKTINGCHFEEKEKLEKYIKANLRSGDVILFKASHSMQMDSIVEKLFPITCACAALPYRIKTLRWLRKTV